MMTFDVDPFNSVQLMLNDLGKRFVQFSDVNCLHNNCSPFTNGNGPQENWNWLIPM